MTALNEIVSIIKLTDWLRAIAPMPDIKKLIMRMVRVPSLSVRKPLGMVRIVEHRDGIASMIPSCWRVRPNSTRKTGKSAG